MTSSPMERVGNYGGAEAARLLPLTADPRLSAVVRDVHGNLVASSSLSVAARRKKCKELSRLLLDGIVDHVARESSGRASSSPVAPTPAPLARQPPPHPPNSLGPPRKRLRGSRDSLRDANVAGAQNDTAVPAKKRRAAFSPRDPTVAVVEPDDNESSKSDRRMRRGQNATSPRRLDETGGQTRTRSGGNAPERTAAIPAPSSADQHWKGGVANGDAAIDDSVLYECVRTIVWACVGDPPGGFRDGARHEAVVRINKKLAVAKATLMPPVLTPSDKRKRVELLSALEKRPILTWAPCERPTTFLDFHGCEICLRLCEAERVLLVGGDLYDSRTYWPEPCEYRVESHTQLDSGALRMDVSVQDARMGPPVLPPALMDGPPVAFDRSKKSTKEFWVDKSCSLRCLLYHEFSHFVARVSEAARRIIVDELQKGEILVAKDIERPGASDDVGDESMAKLRRHLAAIVLQNERFMHATLLWLQTACNIRKHVKSRNRRVQVPDDLFDSELELDLDEVAGSHVKLMYQRTQQPVGV